MSVKHKAQALTIHCIDFRFQEMIDQDLVLRGLNGKCDRVAWPGTSKDLDNVTKAAQTSYGNNNSIETHKTNAQNLAAKLKEVKPSIQVTPLLATFEGIKEL